MKKDCPKALRMLPLFCLSNLVPSNGQSYLKQIGSGTSHQSLFRSQNKFRKIPLFVIYYLTKSDDVIWTSFWVIPKKCIWKFMQGISWHHKLFHFQLSFWIWRVWKGREKITQNLNILRTKIAFEMKKKHFS